GRFQPPEGPHPGRTRTRRHRDPDLARHERTRGTGRRGAVPARGHRPVQGHHPIDPPSDRREPPRARCGAPDDERSSGMKTTLKVMRFAFFDLLRSRWMIVYTLFFMLTTAGLLY